MRKKIQAILISFFLGVSVSQPAESDSSLIVHLDMDQVENNQVKDLSGYQHHALLNSNKGLAQGKFHQALDCASGSFLTIPFKESLRLPAGTGLSICLWLKLDAAAVRWAGLVKNDGGKSTAYREFKGFNLESNGSSSPLPLSEASWRFSVKGKGAETLNTGPISQYVAQGNWFHLVAVYDPSPHVRGLLLYLNGELIEDHIMIDLPEDISTDENWIIGKDLTFFPGLIDEVKIFRRALAAEEVRTMYSKEK